MTPSMLRRLRSGEQPSWYDESIVQFLRSTHTPSTIFLTGLWTQAYPEAVRSLAADPLFELGNHTVDHSAFEVPCYGLGAAGSIEAKKSEVTGAAASIAKIAGRKPLYFRFPGGCASDADTALVAGLGEQVIGWDVSSGDAFQPNYAPIVNNVVSLTRPGSIVVFHLMGGPNAPATSKALRELLPILKARGLQFVTVQELLSGR